MLQQKSENFNNEKLDTLLALLHYNGPRPRSQYLCHCPAHDDHNPSLSVTATADGKILLHCFAGCQSADVLRAIGLTFRDLMPQSQPPHQPTSAPPTPDNSLPLHPPQVSPAAKRKIMQLGTIVATYDYCDVNGHLVCQVVRYEPKSFRQRQSIKGEWVWSMQGVRPPLYRLPELLAAPQHEWVFIVEGEKDVESMLQQGLVATCNIQGAGKWKAEYNSWLTNHRVCILPDNDEAGRHHAQAVAQHLANHARQLQILALPNLPEKGDVSDWFAAGGNDQKLLSILTHAIHQRWLPTNNPANNLTDNPANNPANANSEAPLPYLRERKGNRRPTTSEYLDLLIDKMHYDFALNELDDTIEVNGRPMDNALFAAIRCKIRDLGFTDMQALEDAYTAYADKKRYHPVKRYLEGLTWDGKNHLDHLASHLQDNHPPIYYNNSQTSSQTSSQSATVAKVWLLRFLVGAVARVYNHATIPAQPPMLVLDGPQGLGKSTLVRWLGSPLPDLTYEGSINPNYKEMPRLQATKWIWEVPELGATTRHADSEALKAIISAGNVTFRIPYSRHLVRKPTLANFIGTINNEAGFLSDHTGNRRFLAMTLTEINQAYTKQINIDQLWAHIYALYQSDEPWQLLPPEHAMQTLLNQDFQLENPYETWVECYYECDPNHSAQYLSERNQNWFVTTQEIAAYLTTVGFVGNTYSIQQRLATTLKAMGLQGGRMQGARGPRGYYGLRRRT